MPTDIQVDVQLKGPFFGKRIDEETRQTIYAEVLDKAEERLMRQPRSPKLGRKNNTLSAKRYGRGEDYSLDVDSTLNWPRTKGTAWTSYNIAAVRKLAPNVIRAAGRRLAQSLGGN